MSNQLSSSAVLTSREKNRRFILMIMVMLFALPQMAIDLFLPSILAVSYYFHVDAHLAQWSIAVYLFGMSLSQLVYGVMSDAFGRRLPLIIGLVICLIGSLICLTSSFMSMFLVGRFLQGTGAGVSLCLYRVILKDSLQGVELVKAFSYVIMYFALVTPCLPIIGGYLQDHFSWQANFIVLVGYTTMLLLLILFLLPETIERTNQDYLKWTFLGKQIRKVLLNRVFIGNTCVAFFANIAFYGWLTDAPVLLIKNFNLTASSFGWCMFVVGLAPSLLMSYLNPVLVKQYGISCTLNFAFGCILLSGFLLLIFNFLWQDQLVSVLLPLMLFIFGVWFLYPNTYIGALEQLDGVSGIASAIYSTMILIGSSLSSAFFASLTEITIVPLALTFIFVSVVSFGVYQWVLRQGAVSISSIR